MRFAIAAVDRYLGVFESFVRAGWTPLKLFTVPVVSATDNHQAVSRLAEEHRATIQLTRMTDADLQALHDQGCDTLIVACYPWRMGDWRPYLKYGINFHAAPLPEARGPYPLHRAILEKRSRWAVTCHQLSLDIDRGPILACEPFSMQTDECHESLDLKIQMVAKRLSGHVAVHIHDLWAQAVPQSAGSYWPRDAMADRIIDFGLPVDSILLHIRAFGASASLACFRHVWLVIRRAVGWREPHGYAAGQAVHVSGKTLVIAASDGFVGLIEADVASPGLVQTLTAELAARKAS